MEQLYQTFRHCNGISTDTRNITQGSLFVALKGANFDANTMVDKALSAGAAHVITSNTDFAADPRVTIVSDTLSTLQQLAAYHRKQLDIPIIGITGTNGKTTTKELIAAVLRTKYNVYATLGNHNNHIGVPLSLLSITDDCDIAVIEMGANHPGEIRDLVTLVRPTAGLITNVGIAHIEGFGSFDGVKRTKAELYDQLKADRATVFINATNANLIDMLGDYDRCISYGTDADTCFVDGHITNPAETLCFEWRHSNAAYRSVETHLTGAYNLENALAAAAVGTFFDVAEASICEAISQYQPTNSRSQIVVTQRNRVIMDAYNANPSSMTASVDNFAALPGNDKTLILGAMRELGTESHDRHAALLQRIDELGFTDVYLIGEEFSEFHSQYAAYHYYSNVEQAISDVRQLTSRYVLVKGSNSTKLGSLQEHL